MGCVVYKSVVKQGLSPEYIFRMIFPLSSLFKTASSNRYKFKARLAGHHDSITGVAFSNSGSLLASAGEY